LFLKKTERGIEQQDQTDGARFDRPGTHPLVQPQAEIEREREQQDVDQGAGELPDQAAPQTVWSALCQGVWPETSEAFDSFCGGQSDHSGTTEECARRRRPRASRLDGVTGIRTLLVPS